jgi:dTDP-4-dehydrorhamnose 3,5-epimerase
MDYIYKNNKFIDHRGIIYTIYDKQEHLIEFVQDKITKSKYGTIRGFHGDSKTWKLITCLHGKIKLVTFDLKDYLKKEYILDSDDIDNTSILVSPNSINAHQCLTDLCIFHYKWSEFYTQPEQQWTINYNDPDINAGWDESMPVVISDRDRNGISLQNFINNNNKL